MIGVRIDKICHARFGPNDYSVPPDYAGARLALVAYRYTVRIVDGTREVAHHQNDDWRRSQVPRSFHSPDMTSANATACWCHRPGSPG